MGPSLPTPISRTLFYFVRRHKGSNMPDLQWGGFSKKMMKQRKPIFRWIWKWETNGKERFLFPSRRRDEFKDLGLETFLFFQGLSAFIKDGWFSLNSSYSPKTYHHGPGSPKALSKNVRQALDKITYLFPKYRRV